MIHRLTLIVGLLLGISAGAQTPSRTGKPALPPKAVNTPGVDGSYFPHSAGTYWEYSGRTVGSNTFQQIRVLSSIQEGKAKRVVVETMQDGKEQQTETYFVSPTTVSRARSGTKGENTLVPAIPILRFPLKIGDSWNWKGKVKARNMITNEFVTQDVRAVIKVVGATEIRNRSDMFKAIRVDLKMMQGKTVLGENSYWFAPNVGLVRQETRLNTAMGEMYLQSTIEKYQIKR